MAIPNLAPGYQEQTRALAQQREENEKNRKFERDQALKQFGMRIGEAAFGALADVGIKAFDEKLKRPYELADRGVSEYDLPDLPQPDMKSAVMSSGLGKYFGAPAAQPSVTQRPVTYEMDAGERSAATSGGLPAAQPSRAAPPGMQRDASGKLVPVEPDVEPLPDDAPGFAGPPMLSPEQKARESQRASQPAPLGVGSGTMPASVPRPQGTDRVIGPREGEGMVEGEAELVPAGTPGAKRLQPPGPPSAAAPPQGMFNDVAAQRTRASATQQLFEGLKAQGAGALGAGPSAAETLNRRLALMDPKDRAFYRAAELKRRGLEADIGLAGAQARKLDTESDPARIAAEMAKLDAERQKALAQAADFEGKVERAKLAKTPGSREYETLRGKAWEQAALISQRLETRTSGSSSVGGGGAGGGLSISLGGSSKKPLFKVKIVDDGNGWPRIVGPSGDGRYLYRDADGVILDYTGSTIKMLSPENGKETDTQQPVQESRTGKPPARPAQPAKGGTPRVPEKPTVLVPRTPTGEPPSSIALPPGQTSTPFTGVSDEALEAQRRKLVADAQSNPAGARKLMPEVTAITAEQAKRKAAAEKAEKDTKTRVQTEGSLDDAASGVGTLREAVTKASMVTLKDLGYTGDEVDGVLDAGDALKAAKGEAAPKSLSSEEKAVFKRVAEEAAALKSTKLQSAYEKNLSKVRKAYRAAGLPDGQFYQWLESRKVAVPASMRSAAPGPSTPSPGQPPPPPGRQSQVDPADDLFNKINALPWSAARKRRVFMAEAQKRGLA